MRLGTALEARVGRETRIDREQLGAVLRREGLVSIASTINRPVSQTSERIPARYFVIHDTSQKLRGDAFPDDTSPSLNRLGFRDRHGDYVAHIFLNRLGQILVGHDFSQRRAATKFEYKVGQRGMGLFLHIENNQPRLRDTAVRRNNDRIAPVPGFTLAQYDRLALLYITASARAGYWLVPAYHAVIDAGIRGGHDDPQNFDREAFEGALERRAAEVEGESAGSAGDLSPPLQATSRPNARPLRATLYYTALQDDYPPGRDAAFRTRSGVEIARVSSEFMRKADIEGSAKLSDGRVLNVDGRIGGERRWKVIPQAYGLDAVGCGLIPFRSAAVDRTVIPLRTRLHIAETVGMPLPDGTRHDGTWYAVDTGSSIQGDRIDLFVGAGLAGMRIPYEFGIAHLRALTVVPQQTFTGCRAN